MKRDNNIMIAMLLFCLLMTGCTSDESMTEMGYADGDFVGQPVLFSAGNVGETQVVTRAGVPYMAQNGRFVCTMYYHAGANDTDDSEYDTREGGTMKTAWLKVNNGVGNSVYRQKDFTETDITTDNLGFDKHSNVFYWQNRLKHAFLALADYNQLKINIGATEATGSQGKLKMYPYGDTEEKNVNVYDLTRGEKTSIDHQPDPIVALTIMKPGGSTQEANRVELCFEHQFSQIQVNLKGAGDGSASVTAAQITKVELLGVSKEGYVSNHLNADGTVNATVGKKVKLEEDYTPEQLAVNEYGTSFEMFDMGAENYALNFVKSFNAIAFGELKGIRVTWQEENSASSEWVHVATYKVPMTLTIPAGTVQLSPLLSGKKYVYDLELRRGTLAVIRTKIIDWGQKEELVFDTNGTITN